MTGPCRGTTTHGVPVSEAALSAPRTSPQDTTVGQARALFVDDHLHALLVVDGGRLLAVVERGDLVGAAAGTPAGRLGRVVGRTVSPAADLGRTHAQLLAQGRRRLAVVDADGLLVGLLCLKRSGLGFCTDADVRARAEERAAPALAS